MTGTTKSVSHAGRKKFRSKYRVLDTVRTARGEGVIQFVFTRIRDGKTSYSVNFSNKRMGIIFHESELTRCAGRLNKEKPGARLS
jgi:hypothetical protein